MNKKFNSAFWICTIMIFAAAAFRVISNHFNNELGMWNFAPIGAIALFAGVRFSDKKFSFIIPITAMLLSDVFIGFHSQMFPVYLSFVLITCIGILVSSKENVFTVASGSLLGSVVFFLVTNLVIWYDGSLNMYSHTLAGQLKSYTEALPFFRHTVISDLVFNGVLFGSWYAIKKGFLAPSTAKA